MSQSSKQVPAVPGPIEHGKLTMAILDFVSEVPVSHVEYSDEPSVAARKLANRAAQRAALTAGSLALPPGPLGWLTLLPELIAIWKIQGQLVSDIAAVYGRRATLGREQMMWCLFRHTAAQAFRDLVVRLGDRLIFRRMSHSVAQRVAKQIGVKLTQRTVSKGLSRWLPVIGALGVGAYAYYDTGQVASTAIELFSGEAEIVDGNEVEPVPVKAKRAPRKATSAARRAVAKVTDRVVTMAARKASKTVAKKATKKAAKKVHKPKAD